MLLQLLEKGKQDKIDSIRIANYGIDNWFHLTKQEANEEIYEELKFLGRQYSHYIKIKLTACWHLLVSLIGLCRE